SMFFGYFMAALDTTILITTLGSISSEFGSIERIGWVGSAYLLSVSVCQPVYTSIAEIIGQQISYCSCVIIFIIGSILCAVSNSMTMLIVCRAIQGVGGTGLLISVLVITIDLMPPAERAKYQGILGIALGAATLLGPIIGGALADIGQWRWCFYLNIFIGVPLVVIIAVFCKLPPTEKQLERLRQEKTIWDQIKQIDYATVGLLMPSCCILLVGLQLGAEDLMFTRPEVLSLLIIGPILVISFIFVEVFFVKSNPAFPRNFMSSRHNVAVLIGNFMSGVMLNAFLYFTPLQFQIVKGDTAVASAIKLFPLFIGTTVGGLLSGVVMSRTGYSQIFLLAGPLCALIGSALFQQSTISTSLVVVFTELAVFGLGTGAFKNALVVAGQAGVPRKYLVIATSSGQFSRMMGGAFGVNIAAVIFTYYSQTSINQLKTKFHTKSVIQSLDMIQYLPTSIQTEIKIAFLDSINKIYILGKHLDVLFIC
ncbi:MFS general substrate transporter, partial [Backusella circina FSU 941]